MSPSSPEVIRVLTFDGGGVRGLSSLIILREFVERLQVMQDAGTSKPTSKPPRPCDIFDLIVGTGTGGISALFLGRLHMTVDQAIEEYCRMAETVYKSSSGFPGRYFSRSGSPTPFDGDKLADCLGGIVARYLGSSEALMYENNDGPRCRSRVAVLAATSANADSPPYIFRMDTVTSSFKVVDIARATSATAGLFPAVSFGTPPITFIDAGSGGYNNPTEIALAEAGKIWPGSHVVVLSLGTGTQRIVDVRGPTRWRKAAYLSQQLIESCEPVHDRLVHAQSLLSYFRFSVDRGLDRVGVKEWAETGDNGRLAGITSGYLRKADSERQLDLCVQVFHGGSDPIDLIKAFSGVTSSGIKGIAIECSSHPSQNLPPEVFHGREEYIDMAVKKMLDIDGAHLAILGSGGIGKTSIALAILHNIWIALKYREENRHFISCEAITSGVHLVNALAMALGVQSLVSKQSNQLGALLLYLQQTYTAQPLLLVFDNFETLWEVESCRNYVEKFLKSLCHVHGVAIIVTMRGSNPPGAPGMIRWDHLPVVKTLSLEASRKTYLSICPTDDASLDKLLTELDNVPLAVVLLAYIGKKGHSPTRLLERWREEHISFLNCHIQQPSHLTSVEMSIQLSLKSPAMIAKPEAQQLLSLISLLPGGVLGGQLPSIIPSLTQPEKALDVLSEAGLVYHDHDETLHVLSPIRAYMLAEHFPSEMMVKDLEHYFHKLAELGKFQPEDLQFKEASKLLQKIEGNMETILRHALTYHPNCDALQAALNFTRFLCITRPRISVIKLAIQVADDLEETDYQAQCFQTLGNIFRLRHKYDEAYSALMNSKSLFETIVNPLGKAHCLQTLSGVHRMTRSYSEATIVAMEAKALFEAHGDQLGAVQCLQILGNILRMEGSYSKAQDALLDAKNQFETIGNQLGATQCLRSLGDILVMQGTSRHDEAQLLLTKAKSQFEAIGNYLGIAMCCKSLAEILWMKGQDKEAQVAFTQAKVQFESLENPLGSALCLQRLGDILLKQGDLSGAKSALATAKAQFETIGYWKEADQCLEGLKEISQL